MAWHIYSSESLPNPDFMGRPGYTPDSEYIRFGGVSLPVLPKGQWVKLPDSFLTMRSKSWKEPREELEINVRRFKGIVESPKPDAA